MMSSTEPKSKQSIRRRPHVGRKIKFYETKDEDEERELTAPVEIETEKRHTVSKSATLPNRKNPSDEKPSVTDVTRKLKVRSARNRDSSRNENDAGSEPSREYLDTHAQLDENDNIAGKTKLTTNQERRSRERTRGLDENLSVETQQAHTLVSNSSKDEQTPQNLESQEQAIPFLSTRDIGQIYQSQPQQRQANRQIDSMSPDANEYHWKIVESRKNLQELQKSLSDDISGGKNIERVTTDYYPTISADVASEIPQVSAHTRVSKQESTTSVSSNLSTSSTISKKLMSLSETPKTDKISRRRSQKSKSRDLTRRQESLNSRERSGSQTYNVTNKSRRHRQTISAIQYGEDDLKSPTYPATKSLANDPIEKVTDISASDVVNTSASVSSPPDTDGKEEPSNDFFNKYSSNTAQLHKDNDGDDSKQRQGKMHASDERKLSSSVRETRSRAARTFPEKETSHTRSYSGKFNSMPRTSAKYVFKVDLDEQHNYRYSSRTQRYKSQRSSREDNETKLEAQGRRKEKESNEDESKREHAKEDSTSIQTKEILINQSEPVATHSKRLQVRPWNMLGHLSNNVTQTTRTATRDTISQTKKRYFDSTSTQTTEKTYRTTGVQTDIVVTKQELAIQTSPSVKTVEVQTADELSEGATVSLDNLIRMGAIKRTRSLGLGLSSPTLDRPIVRSSSSNYKTNLRKEATEVNSNKPVTISTDGTETSGKITTYNWSENKKFVKIFVSYSGIHLLPSKNIQVKTNGINLLLTVEECVSRTKDGEELRTLTSSLYLNRLRRPVSCLSYNVQRDMVTIMLRKQKQTPWNALLFSGANA